MIDIVDENDNVLGSIGKDDSYKQGLRRRIVNIAVIDPVTKKIAVQLRGDNVSWQPGHYCISACGHVSAGEDWEPGAARELSEELNVTASLKFIDKFPFTDEFGQDFILGVYAASVPHDTLRGHTHEVGKILSLDKSEIQVLISKGDKLHNLFVSVIEKLLETL
jgi:8-oxo-dGTP pyrophosphatase MutT (NUDIX family)